MSAHDDAMNALAEARAALAALTQIYDGQSTDVGAWFSKNEGRAQRIALAHVSSQAGVLVEVLRELTQHR